MTLDLSAPRKVHIVGIGGMAMSGIAAVLTRLGHTVSGSDLKVWRGLRRLRPVGVHRPAPHDPARPPAGGDAAMVPTPHPAPNPEVAPARARGGAVTAPRRARARRH